MFPKYPYLDLSDRNLDFLTKAIREMENEVKNFVSLNAVKYANPIQWSINRQYEKNTITIDPLTGTAFISVQPVPRGVSLTRAEYWVPVFDLSQFVTKAASNFANTYERDITTTATMPTGAGDWVVWDSTLYMALTSIHAGDAYVVNGNIKRMTVEDFYNLLMQAIHDLDEELDTEIRNRTEADGVLRGNIDAEERAREEADTTLQGNIDAEERAREEEDTTLQGNIDEEALARERADRTLQGNIDEEALTRAAQVGDLNVLATNTKSNIVAAINEIYGELGDIYDKCDIRNYGGVADGQTDCTSAVANCLSDNNVVYLPNYNNQPYKVGAITLADGQSVIGDEGTTVTTSATNLFVIVGNNVEIKNLIVNTDGNVVYINSNAKALSFIHIENVYSYGATRFIWDNANAVYSYTNLYVNRCAARRHKSYGVDITKCYAFLIMEDVTIDCVGEIGVDPCFRLRNNAGAHLTRCEAEGGLTDGSHGAHGGFVLIDCQAVWFNRCMADTLDGSGFAFTNSQYIYMYSCVASLCGAHGVAILSTTCLHILISNMLIAGRRGMTVSPSGAHGIYNFNNYVQITNCDIYSMTGYAIADSAAGSNNLYSNLNIDACSRSFVSSSGGGIVSNVISNVNDVPAFGNYKHRLVVANGVLYDSPLGV